MARPVFISLLLMCAGAVALTSVEGQAVSPYELRIDIEAPLDDVRPAGLHTDRVSVTVTCAGILSQREPLEVPLVHHLDGAHWEGAKPDRSITLDAQDCLHERPTRYSFNVSKHLWDEGGAVHPVALRVATDHGIQTEARWNLTTEPVYGAVNVWKVHHPWLPTPKSAETVRFSIILHNPNNNAVETQLEAETLPGATLHAEWPDHLGPSERLHVHAEYTPGNATGWCCPGDHVFHNVTIHLTYAHPDFNGTRTDVNTFPLFFERAPSTATDGAVQTAESPNVSGSLIIAIILGFGFARMSPLVLPKRRMYLRDRPRRCAFPPSDEA